MPQSNHQVYRNKVLNKRIKIDRSIVLTDRVFRNQINSLSAIVARIGVDYNQATKRFNSLVKQKRADGSPVINSRAANYMTPVGRESADPRMVDPFA